MPSIAAILSITGCAAMLLIYKAARQLAERNRLDRQALDAATDGMFLVSESGQVESLNRMAEITFVTTALEAVGKDIRQFIAPESEPAGETGDCDYLRISSKLVGRTPDGTSFPVSVRVCEGHLRGRRVHAVLVRDESRKQQLGDSLREYADQLKLAKESLEFHNQQLEETIRLRTAQLEEAKLAAEEANEIKSAFLANVSHELRTPLHGILSFSRFGLRKYNDVPVAKLVQYFQRIEESGTSLLHIINQLLDLTKLESGKIPLDLAEVDIPELVARVVESFTGIASDRRIDIEIHEINKIGNVVADGEQLAQVLRNLLGNALRFAPEESIVDIAISELSGSAVISVSDQGPGVPDNELVCIFDKFVQSANQNNSGGTGLGLAICREIVQLHNGWIGAANRPTGGAVFSFSIPLSCAHDLNSSAMHSDVDANSSPHQTDLCTSSMETCL